MKSEVVDKFVEQMLVMLQDASAFAKAEIPLICQEVIAYGRVKYTLFAVIAFAGLILGMCLIRSGWKKDGYKEMDAQMGLVMGGSIISFFGLIGTLGAGEQAVMVWAAPRLFLIGYFKELVR